MSVWSRFEADDESDVYAHGYDEYGPPMLSFTSGGSTGVSVKGSASFARDVAEKASDWADLMAAYEAGQEDE